jgi:hypothetical protein
LSPLTNGIAVEFDSLFIVAGLVFLVSLSLDLFRSIVQTPTMKSEYRRSLMVCSMDGATYEREESISMGVAIVDE